ncbi:MAG: helix-turn-helix domain-containing protein [Bacteroidetes bacterium]|nr:helix-turn-helix domain-containing protein [Bacteroidota bacterium]
MATACLQEDLIAIRTARQLSLADIEASTQIGRDILAAMEAGCLHERGFSVAHQRGLYRAYAQALGLDFAHLWQAVCAHQAGAYRGSLGYRYLGRALEAEELEAEIQASMQEQDLPKPPRVLTASILQADISAARIRVGRLLGGMATLLGLFALGVLLYAAWSWRQQVAIAPSDVARAEVQLERFTPRGGEESATGSVVLPDTLFFTIEAASGPLDPIRVRLDNGSSVRYWIERGQRRTFYARDSFALRGPVSRLRLWILNRSYREFPDTLDYTWVRFTRKQLLMWLADHERLFPSSPHTGGGSSRDRTPPP